MPNCNSIVLMLELVWWIGFDLTAGWTVRARRCAGHRVCGFDWDTHSHLLPWGYTEYHTFDISTWWFYKSFILWHNTCSLYIFFRNDILYLLRWLFWCSSDQYNMAYSVFSYYLSTVYIVLLLCSATRRGPHNICWHRLYRRELRCRDSLTQ